MESGEAQGSESPKYRLMIGIPTYGMPRCEFSIDSGWSLLYHIGRRHPEIEKVWVQRDVRTYRQEARKAIVESAQQAGATHLLMLDDDHVFDGETFDKLWASMQQADVQLVSGLYMTRGLPCAPCIFKLTAQGTVPIFYYEPDTLMEVDVVGFGFVLFDMALFTRINPPWFNLGFGFGEDAAFCARVIQAGMKVWVHTGAQVGHLLEQPHVITEADYLRDRNSVWKNDSEATLVPAGLAAPMGEASAVGSQPRWRPLSSRRWSLWGKNKLGATHGEQGTASGNGGEGVESPAGVAEG
jgi:hypothetical protein